MASPHTKSGSAPDADTAEASPSARRRNSPRRELVTNEILEHATRLFAQRGYDGTTLQDIADAVGLTRPGLYNYIKNKEELLAALVADMSEGTATTMKTIRRRLDQSPTDKLREAITSLVLQRATAPERFRVLDRTESSLPEPIATTHRRAKRTVLTELQAIIDQGISAGSMRPKQSRIAALSVIGMCNWVAWWFDPKSGQPAMIAAEIADNAIDMLAEPTATGRRDPRASAAEIRIHLDYLEGLAVSAKADPPEDGRTASPDS